MTAMPQPAPRTAISDGRRAFWRIDAAVEVAPAVTAVLLDVFAPRWGCAGSPPVPQVRGEQPPARPGGQTLVEMRG